MSISKDNDRLTIIISKESKKELEQIAKEDKRSTSNYVANLLEEHINEKRITVRFKKHNPDEQKE
jgi:predicted DNA-binding protein